MEVSEEHIVNGVVSASEVLSITEAELSEFRAKEEKGFYISEANRAGLCNRLRCFTKLMMGIHKGIRWIVDDETFEEFMKRQNAWHDFLEPK